MDLSLRKGLSSFFRKSYLYSIVDIGPRNFKRRQELLSKTWGFNCNCNLCQKEKVDSDNEKYDEFEKLSEEVSERQFERKNNPEKVTGEKLYREIIFYIEMYKFAKEKRASRQYLIRNILTPGESRHFLGSFTNFGP